MVRGMFFFIFIICSAITYSQKETADLWDTWAESNDHSKRITSMIDIIWEEYIYNQPDSALYYTDIILKLSTDHELKGLEADVYNLKGSIYWIIGENSKAIDCYTKSLIGCLEMNYLKGIGNSYNNLGMVYSELGENDSAISYYNKSMIIRDETGDIKSLSSSYMNIGTYYFEIGNLPLSLTYYFKSLKIDQELGYEEDIAMVLSNIGLVYSEQKDFDRAIEYFYKSIEIDQKHDVKLGVFTSVLNIANVYQKENKLEKALICYEKGLEIAEELKIDKQIAKCLNSIGNSYLNKGELEVAMDYFQQAYNIRIHLNEKVGLASSLNNIGNVYFKFKEYAKAIDYNERSYQLSKESGSIDRLIKTSKSLYDVYKAIDEYPKALEMYEDYILYRDSLFNEDNLRSSIQLEFSHKFTNDSIQKLKDDIEHEKDVVLKQFKHDEEISQFRFYAVVGGSLSLIMCLMAIFLYRQNKLKQKTNKQIQLQKDVVDLKNKEVTESIVYAKRIQDAILTSKEYIDQALPDCFVMYKPKDLVSGDFYWVFEENKVVYFSVVDCTGHGVPGAFMSMIGYSLLNEIVIESKVKQPNLILEQLNSHIKSSMENKGSLESRDGMDMAFCKWEKSNNLLTFSGAKNPLILVRKGELFEYKGDDRPVGYITGKNIPFTQTTLALEEGDMLYMYSDGYSDQFGGVKGKKFKSSNFKKFLLNISNFPIDEQYKLIQAEYNQWKGNYEQIDDVCVMGC